MNISQQAVAELAALSETFDEPGFDLLRSLTRFVDEVRLAVPSYLGVTVIMTTPQTRSQIDVVDELLPRVAVGSSLMIPASHLLGQLLPLDAGERPGVVLIVYASAPGSLVDLAADLGWLTSVPLADLALDAHLIAPKATSSSLTESSLVNQAVGALLGSGLTPEQASEAVVARAATQGISKGLAASVILDELTGVATPPEAADER